jgi:hypothetical protein
MSEEEGEWSDLLYESAREVAKDQDSEKSVSVSEPSVTLPQRTRYVTSFPKENTLTTMSHFFGPVGSVSSGTGKGLVTHTTNFLV